MHGAILQAAWHITRQAAQEMTKWRESFFFELTNQKEEALQAAAPCCKARAAAPCCRASVCVWEQCADWLSPLSPFRREG